MSGIQGQVLTHLVRRGVHHITSTQQLHNDAELYENAGSDMKIHDYELLPIVITGLVVLLITASIRYTVGEVIATLTMIESQTSTAIIEDKPPAYADEPDAPLEKEALLPAEAEADVEVTLIKNKPITSKITSSVGHLHRVGGFRARWRGLGLSMLYHFVHILATNFIVFFVGPGVIARAFAYVFVSISTARLHMVWTHSMIAYPAAQPFWRRFVSRKDAKLVIMPAFVFALAQQATLLLPLAMASILGVTEMKHEHFLQAAHHEGCGELALILLRVLAVPITALAVAFFVLLPATVALTRVEALLLPEGQETIVPFDRQAIVAGIDINKCGCAKGIFASAWRSFDRASRWRLIKLYTKLVLIQITVFAVGVHIMLAELYVIGGERLAVLFKSAFAQGQLMAIEAQENAN